MLSHGVPKGLYPVRTGSSRSRLARTALQQEQAHQAAAVAWHSSCMGRLVGSLMPGSACAVRNFCQELCSDDATRACRLCFTSRLIQIRLVWGVRHATQ